MIQQTSKYDVAVIGGGIVGLYTTLDLSLRGFKVVLIERQTIGSGTSGRMHGLLHSGARYAAIDPKAAIECATESRIMYETARYAIDDTGGYFLAVDKEDEKFLEEFLKGLKRAEIKYKIIDPDEAIKEEPHINRNVRAVVEVPDKVVKAGDILGGIALSAYIEGAKIIEYAEVIGFKISQESIEEILVKDNISGVLRSIKADVVVNASGPWSGKIASMANLDIEVMPTAGIMIVIPIRLSKRVINRLRPPSDGDIVLPYAGTSIAGTTARVIEDPDEISIDEEDIMLLLEEGSKLLPEIKKIGYSRIYHSVRPLIRTEGERAGREATRDFKVIVHEKPSNIVSVIGGKFTTGRLVAEKTSDEIAKILGSTKSSRTKDYKLREASEEYLGDLEPHMRLLVKEICDKKLLDFERTCSAVYKIIVSYINKMSRKILGWT